MGGKSKPKQPKTPDPYQVAEAQTKSNIDTARKTAELNRVNEVNPYGSLTYTEIGPDQFQREVTLSPEQQRLLEAQQGYTQQLYGLGEGLAGSVGEILNNPLTTDFSADRRRVENAIFSRLNPQFDRDRASLENRLANQGIALGSDAYRTAMEQFNQSVNDARQQAVLGAGQEQSRLFGLDTAARNQALSELLGLYGAARGVNVPNFAQSPQVAVAPTDVSGNVYNSYNAALNSYNQALQNQSSTFGSLLGLGGTIAGAAFGGPAGAAIGGSLGGAASGTLTNPYQSGGVGSFFGY